MCNINTIATSIVIVAMCKLIKSVHAVTSQDLNAVIRPESCKNDRFCNEKPETYPDIFFENLLMDSQNRPLKSLHPYSDTRQQSSNTDDGMNCGTIETIITPFIAKVNTTDYYVIQTKHFEQKLLQTQCATDGAPCFGKLTASGMTSVCKQSFGTVKLLLYHPIRKQPIYKNFLYPSCCSCGFKTDDKYEKENYD